MQSQKNILMIYSLLFLLFLALFVVLSKNSGAYFEDMFEQGDSVSEEISAVDDPSTDDNSSEDLSTDSDDQNLSGTVYLEGEFLDGDILKISVFAEDISAPVLGTAFHLIYEKEKLMFLKYEPGDFLEQGGDPFYLVKNFNENAKIIFGETLRQDDSFPVGGGKIVDLYFQIADGVDFIFKFENGAISSLDSVRQDLANIEWKELSLNKNGSENISDYSNGQVSVLNQSFFWSTKNIALLLTAVFGFSFIVSRLIKKFRRYYL